MIIDVRAQIEDELYCSGCKDAIDPPAKTRPAEAVHDLVPGWLEHLRVCPVALTGAVPVQVLVRFRDDWDVRLVHNLPRRYV